MSINSAGKKDVFFLEDIVNKSWIIHFIFHIISFAKNLPYEHPAIYSDKV